MRKFILIPEYRPLYAMAKCFGPTHGPLSKPCPTPVDIIGQLLLQKGKDAITIYETKYDDKGNTMPPLMLTLDNYKLPYEEIAGIKEDAPAQVFTEMPKVQAPVEPVIEPAAPIEDSDIQEEINEPEIEEPVNEIQEREVAEDEVLESIEPKNDSVESTEITIDQLDAEEKETEEESEPVVETPSENPYAGMTKAERRRAKREEAAKAAATNAN